jgi:hypothetical protein
MPNLSLTDVTMRPASGTGSNYVRIGDGGGSDYTSTIDWLIWSNEAVYTRVCKRTRYGGFFYA